MAARVAWISVAPVKGLALAQRDEVLLERSAFATTGAST